MRVGLGAQTFGFFFKPLIEELGWSRTVMTAALLARDLVSAGVYPVAGYAVDRYGPRFLMAGSAVVLGISLMLLSQTREIWQFVLFYGVIGTFGVPGLGYGVVSPTIAKWFIRHRGQATGIATAGLNVGAVALTPLILFLIQVFGWRTAWFFLGFVPWIVVVPPSLLWLRRQPEDMGLLPDGDTRVESSEPDEGQEPGGERQDPTGEVSWTVRQAVRAPAFWLLVAYEVLAGMSLGAPDHPPDPLRDGSRIFRGAGGDLLRDLRHLRYRGQAGLGISGRPLLDLDAGHNRPDIERRQHISRRGLYEHVAAVRHVRGDVRSHRRFAGGDWAPAVGGAFRSASPGYDQRSDEPLLPHRQHRRAIVRRVRLRPVRKPGGCFPSVRRIPCGQRGIRLARRAREELGRAGWCLTSSGPYR